MIMMPVTLEMLLEGKERPEPGVLNKRRKRSEVKAAVGLSASIFTPF